MLGGFLLSCLAFPPRREEPFEGGVDFEKFNESFAKKIFFFFTILSNEIPLGGEVGKSGGPTFLDKGWGTEGTNEETRESIEE